MLSLLTRSRTLCMSNLSTLGYRTRRALGAFGKWFGAASSRLAAARLEAGGTPHDPDRGWQRLEPSVHRAAGRLARLRVSPVHRHRRGDEATLGAGPGLRPAGFRS